MKQAILIVAHSHFNHLEAIIRHFDEDFLFYIHVDKKTKLPPAHRKRLEALPQVQGIWQRYSINWGDVALVHAILLLCREALKNKDVGYLHHISGQDFPVKTPVAFKAFFNGNAHLNFVEHFSLPAHQWHNHPWSEGGVDRLTYWYPCRFINWRTQKGEARMVKLAMLQHRYGIRRPIPAWMPPLYGGSVFWSLNRVCVQYLMDYTQSNKRMLRRFEFSLSGEEIYFHTVLLNGPFRKSILNNNLRFISWETENGTSPANLDETAFEAIKASDAFFARKFQSPGSDGLLQKLQDWMQPLPGAQKVLDGADS